MKIDIGQARTRGGSRYPKPFNKPCRNMTGVGAGSPQRFPSLFLRGTACPQSGGSATNPPLADPCPHPSLATVSDFSRRELKDRSVQNR
jgi:hypothetical protein